MTGTITAQCGLSANMANSKGTEQLINELTENLLETVEKLTYYGRSDIEITPFNYFTYEKNEETKTVRIIRYIGTATDVVIPHHIDGYEVMELGYKEICDENGVTRNGVFEYKTALTSVIIPNTVKNIGCRCFYNCRSLTSMIIPDSVTSIEYWAFSSCVGITSITLGKNLKKIGEKAFRAARVESIVLPDSLEAIGQEAFAECINLTNVTIPSNIKRMDLRAFQNTPFYNDNKTENGDFIMLGNFIQETQWEVDDEGLLIATEIRLPENLKYIPSYLFQYQTNVTNIIIPDSVTGIGDGAFEGVAVVDFYLQGGLEYIGDYAFADNYELTSITIHNSVTHIGECAFYNCTSLAEATLSNNLKEISNHIFSCCALTSITIPNSVTSIGDYAFECCPLTSITIPDSVTSIGEGAFQCCSNLFSLFIPNSVTSIGGSAFAYCGNLAYVKFPYGLQTIPAYCCEECGVLQVIVIGTGLQIVGESAFSNTSLNYVLWAEASQPLSELVCDLEFDLKFLEAYHTSGDEHHGTTSTRPVNPQKGFMYYNTTTNQPQFYNGTVWKNSTGTTVS